jgi:hypothetical protein
VGEVPLGFAGYWLVGNWVVGCLLTSLVGVSRVGGGQGRRMIDSLIPSLAGYWCLQCNNAGKGQRMCALGL